MSRHQLQVLNGHTGWVKSVSFSTDGTRIVSGSYDKSVRVWDTLTGQQLQVLNGHTDRVESVSFSRDDTRIASGSYDTSVRVWDLHPPLYEDIPSDLVQRGDGWFTIGDHKHIMWAPRGIRFHHPYLVIISSKEPHVNLRRSMIGPVWHKCYAQ